ncbi:hypothetical protein GTN31_07125 [Macrococcoides canis]|uniref:SMI1/KNR4 family protein n=1 Tax=Macrococcoides canis TaxID=1855823 RepID=UPI0013E975F0|nr:SMI1/KNR4 family protein [Macrococcus canis]QIH76130.1 hypothetical protein GTN31_07125 [Macrococcus canis]
MNIDNLEYIESEGEKITKNEIIKFETWRGYKLPEDFVEFTLKYPFAHMSAEFDADGRPDSMISNMLRFSKEGYSSIYIDEAYDIKDFGPYVLFGEDPGGNYIAFDYSKDELNPSVVFIDHEELGVLELPEGTSENDFTEEELDKMMSSEKLEDFPWTIHYVAESFTEFLNKIEFRDINNAGKCVSNISEIDLKKIEEKFNMKLPSVFLQFMKKYSSFTKNAYDRVLINQKMNLIDVLSVNTKDSDYIVSVIESRGGFNKFPNLIPFMYINYNWNVFDFSLLCLYKKDDIWTIVIYLEEFWTAESKEIIDNLIHLTDDIDEFFNILISELETN